MSEPDPGAALPPETRYAWRCPECGWENRGLTRADVRSVQASDTCKAPWSCAARDREVRGIDLDAPPGAARVIRLPPRTAPKREYVAEEPWDGIIRRQFESKVFDTSEWLRQSDGLMAAAKLFEPTIDEQWQRIRTFNGDLRTLPSWDARGVYFMLVGFAVENLLKGALVFSYVPTNGVMYFRTYSPLYGEISQGDLPGLLKNHDLPALAQRLELELSPEEEDLLHRLTRATEWYGRYPVPVRYEELEGTRRFGDGKRYSVSYSAGDDVERVKRLIQSLEKKLGRTRRKVAGATDGDESPADEER
ncbi:MAG: hypothetical protein M3547_00990 [Acidobacteriota bacterium]|nr:hypothetical protein [Acidobacteriota bacterium]